MAKYLFSLLLLLTTTATSTSTSIPICPLSPTPSPTSASAPAPTPNPSSTLTSTFSPTTVPSPSTSTTLTKTFAPTAVPSPTTNTTLILTFAPTAALSPTTTIPTPTPSAPTAINNTTATSTALTLTLTPTLSSTPTSIPTTGTTLTPTSTPSPAPTPTSSSITTTFSLPPTPPSPLKPQQQEDLKFTLQEQIYNIIDAVLGAGDFKNWANVLTMADPTTFPISATLFIPSDSSLSPTTTTADPYIFPYHIVPQRLSFADLRQFKTFSRLPTLLLDKSILISNNSASNFTLDGSCLTHPDIYTNAAIAVHGINNLLDYSGYGAEPGKNSSGPNTFAPPSTPASAPPPTPPRIFVPSTDDEELTVHHHGESDAGCLCTELWTVFLILCVFLASKFQRMILIH